MADEWPNVCVLCAARDRQTRLRHGHCCAQCADRIAADIRAIADLAAQAAAWIEPAGSSSGGSRPVPSSRPPVNVEALDPALALVGPPPSATVLDVVESWTKLVREARGMAPYGPWTAHRATEIAGGSNDTGVTLVACTTFLGAQVEWTVSEPEFPLEDFASELRDCVRVLRRWDTERDDATTYVVECPHQTDDGTCGKRLRIAGQDAEGYFHCPRCSTEWSVDRLMLVWAETSDAAMWLDADAIIKRYGVDRSTLDRWVSKGRIGKWHGLYDIRPLALAQRRGA